ncbi:SPOR domain-containing protein [Campylobacter sp. CLAX-7218-21]|uniref:SPOR domain-containing protein n=1 Tax=Campylobacter devanensis TaxID=3161138 RepID=UPI000A356662|nr:MULTISPECIES: SPOR domain-containing protein [unclassified Campylobacter]MEE3711500.1 SPOR domain-containing protein [Campylobacter sp. CLAX-7218-21]
MEENNNLQDILLDKNEEEKSGGIRKILIGVALLVIIFVVVLIVVKFLNSNETKKGNDISDSLLLPAELPANTSNNSGSNDLFEQVPIVSDNSNSKESFENIVNEYKNAQAAMDTTPSMIVPVLPPKVEEPFGATAPAVKDNKKEPVKKSEPAKKVEPVKKVETKKEPVKKSEPVKKVETKKEPATTSGLAKGTYIQVASVSKLDRNSALIKRITANGYKYTTHEVVVNGNKVVKILIGPFDSNIESNIQKIRQDVSSGAFVYRVK